MSNGDDPITVLRDELNRVRGRLFQTVEACGLPAKREDALKGLIRNATYDAQRAVERSLRRKET